MRTPQIVAGYREARTDMRVYDTPRTTAPAWPAVVSFLLIVVASANLGLGIAALISASLPVMMAGISAGSALGCVICAIIAIS